jgi:hypothetical protein
MNLFSFELKYFYLCIHQKNKPTNMKKVSIEFEDETHKELLRIKYEKAMKDEKLTIGEMIKLAVADWLEKQKTTS